ncbi:MAG: DNA repair protein RadA [Bacteroidales bacterium]|nr:DNA repair protein RadA [Bacteroidales bacterium]
MVKDKTVFVCSNCGQESVKWLGRCPSCNEWNTFVEEVIRVDAKTNRNFNTKTVSVPVKINDITVEDNEARIISGDHEFDRVLGGGIVKGSIILVGGEPGIGKSTLMLQLAVRLNTCKILYVSGEESKSQIKMRYDRISSEPCDNVYLLNETDVDIIFEHAEKLDPDILIIDSIQTIYNKNLESSAGTISQVRECTARFQQYAKTTQTPVFLVGHITKDGTIAGPKVLEHIVDVVVMFEGERNYGYRMLRTVKNRFGSASELGIYLMQQNGLVEVDNPSDILISKNTMNLSGVSLAVVMEGLRSIIIETQALVSSSAYGNAQRTTNGFDYRRLNMLLAVLEKRCNFNLASKDVFFNITGGLKIDDPAVDLSVVCAILSSLVDMPLNHECCFAAEIGLSGELRPVPHIEKRIAEAEKSGIGKIIVAGYGLNKLSLTNKKIEVVGLNRIDEVFRHLFG